MGLIHKQSFYEFMSNFRKILKQGKGLAAKAKQLSPYLHKASEIGKTKQHISKEIAPVAAKTVNETIDDIRNKYGPKAEEAFKFALERSRKKPGERASTIIGGGVGALSVQ